ncbi:MAG: GNAT family N-acetyltransferase [Promethearchaeota archaeon]
MVNIIYRHYQKGDDEQLADLFNRAFQMNGFGFVRTPKNWKWRYFNSPGFEADMIQIAEDIENNKIVGMICVNPVEKVNLNGITYLNGNINDVACHPDYIRQGIAKRLMKMSLEYMRKKECDISLLLTGFKGFPRKRLYSKFGYKDFDRYFGYVSFPNLYKLIRDLPAASFLFPLLFTFSFIPRLINKIRIKLNSYFKRFNYEIAFNTHHFEYMESVKKVFKNIYSGYPSFDKRKIIWARIKVSSKRHKPTYITIKKDGITIGGVILTHCNVYSFKYGLKIRIGITHEFFLDKTQFNNENEFFNGYLYIVDKLLKAASRRFLGLLLIEVSSKNYILTRCLKAYNFFKLQEHSIMILKLKDELKISKPEKSLFVPTYLSLGFP